MSEMGRKERRHPEFEDPVAEAQEEATWSGFTRHIRAGSQGKRLFYGRARGQPRGVSIVIIAAISVLGGIAIATVFTLVGWLLGSLS
jgi:hypothetical protein